ncbi:MAG: molecular chaperone DnaJ [bacterium]|nr:molecular chaperone DnaJ [bacterium]
MEKDYYAALGLSKNATAEEIKQAYRRMAHQHHPDKQGGDEAKFKEINEAYQTLKDPDKRRQYDQFGNTFEQARSQGGFSGFQGFSDFSDFVRGSGVNDFGDIFSDFFGGGSGRGRARKPHGRDITVDVELDFIDAVFGVKKEISLFKPSVCSECHGSGAKKGSEMSTCSACNGSGQHAQVRQTFFGAFQSVQTCAPCNGSGKIIKTPCDSCDGRGVVRTQERYEVSIPEGIESETTLRLNGKGEAVRGGTEGDLYVNIHVKPHAKFSREGKTIHSEETIPFSESLLGVTKEVETVDGTVSLEIPPGTRHGDTLRLRAKGAPPLGGGGRGDHLVHIVVTVPKKLSRRQRELIEELREEGL